MDPDHLRFRGYRTTAPLKLGDLADEVQRLGSFRGYRTTAPLKQLLALYFSLCKRGFPWLPNHGSIEAVHINPDTWEDGRFPWLPNHGSIEAKPCRYDP